MYFCLSVFFYSANISSYPYAPNKACRVWGITKEIAFAINSQVSQEGSDSKNDRFLGRSVWTRISNSVNPQLNIEELKQKRIQNHENRIKGHNKRNKLSTSPRTGWGCRTSRRRSYSSLARWRARGNPMTGRSWVTTSGQTGVTQWHRWHNHWKIKTKCNTEKWSNQTELT